MSHLDLCTLELVCVRDKTVLLRLRVEMRRETSTARSGNLYRKLRFSPLDQPHEPGVYDYGAAFAGPGDTVADGRERDLTLTLNIHDGFYTRQWIKQEVKIKVRQGGTYRHEILAVAPMREEPQPQPQAEWPKGGFEGLFGHLNAKVPPRQDAINPVWIEIEAVLVRKRYACAADVSRARKAIALLLHGEGPGHGAEMDALARANAYLDTREKAFQSPLAV